MMRCRCLQPGLLSPRISFSFSSLAPPHPPPPVPPPAAASQSLGALLRSEAGSLHPTSKARGVSPPLPAWVPAHHLLLDGCFGTSIVSACTRLQQTLRGCRVQVMTSAACGAQGEVPLQAVGPRGCGWGERGWVAAAGRRQQGDESRLQWGFTASLETLCAEEDDCDTSAIRKDGHFGLQWRGSMLLAAAATDSMDTKIPFASHATSPCSPLPPPSSSFPPFSCHQLHPLLSPLAGEVCSWQPSPLSQRIPTLAPNRSAPHGTSLAAGFGALGPFWRQCRGLRRRARAESSVREMVKEQDRHSWRAVKVALSCNAAVMLLKLAVYFSSGSSVMLAEAVHSLADLANQGLLAFGLLSSRREPDKLHPYGYSRERFVWALVSATGIFCLGSGLTIMHGIQTLLQPHQVEHIGVAASVLLASALLEGTSLAVAWRSVERAAAAEGLSLLQYIRHGHDPTAVAVLMEDGAAVVGLGVASAALLAVHVTGNPLFDAIGAISVGALLGSVALFLIQRNRHALLGRSMEPHQLHLIMQQLKADPVVDAVWDCKSEMIGPRAYRFKAEIDFNGFEVVRRHLKADGQERLFGQIRSAVLSHDDDALQAVLANYGEDLMHALGSEVDRLEDDICQLVPEVRHVDIEAHSPLGPLPNHLHSQSLEAESTEG